MKLRYAIRHPVAAFTSRVMGTLTRVSVSAPLAALTFDDGPHPRFTPRVAELLERYDARGTFFMVGAAATRASQLIARMTAGGHVIANHSWDHPSFPFLSQRERRRQVLACARVLGPAGRRLFRPPYGHQNFATRFDLLTMGFQAVAWSVQAGDWSEPDPDRMVTALIEQIRPGSVVLLHDFVYRPSVPNCLADRSAMLDALARVLAALSGRFRFVTLPELISAGRPHWDNWFGRPPHTFLDELAPPPSEEQIARWWSV